MTIPELIKEILVGRLLIAGEYRGSRIENAGYVDKKSGEAVNYVRAMHSIECACQTEFDRVLIYQRFPPLCTIESILIPYEKGHLYVFFLSSFKTERGQITGFMADRLPELVEQQDKSGCGLAVPPPGGIASPLP